MVVIQFFTVMIAIICMIACSPPGTSSSSSSGGSGGGGTATTTTTTTIPISTSQPLTLQVSTNWYGTSYDSYQTFAETGTTLCQATSGTPNVTCSITVPEARLYYSDLKIRFSWLNTATACKLLTFQPYYFKSSTSNTFTPPWSTSNVDCTLTDTPADCWGGAARYIVPNFPKYRALIYFPDESLTSGPQQQTVTVNSAYSKKYYSNRLTSNDLAAGKRGNTYTSAQLGGLGDGYVASSMVDYYFSCQDEWYDDVNYSITLYVTDANSSSGSINDFRSWAEAP